MPFTPCVVVRYAVHSYICCALSFHSGRAERAVGWMARPGAPRSRSRAAHIHALHTSHARYSYHQLIALMYWANDVSCVRCRDYRHDVLIGVTAVSRESGASTKQQVSRIYRLDRSPLPTYLLLLFLISPTVLSLGTCCLSLPISTYSHNQQQLPLGPCSNMAIATSAPYLRMH